MYLGCGIGENSVRNWDNRLKRDCRIAISAIRIRGCLQKNSSHHRTPELEDWLCRRGQGGQGRKEAGCSLRSSDETDRGKGLYGGASPVSREGNLDIRHCVLGEGVQGRGEKSGVIGAKCTRRCTCGCNRPLYQNYRTKPYNHPSLDTKLGWLFLHVWTDETSDYRAATTIISFLTRENKGMASFDRIGFVPFRLF